jgi:hypothetical protein
MGFPDAVHRNSDAPQIRERHKLRPSVCFMAVPGP